MRLVTLVPSRPAIGESFTAKRIDSVGGSIGCACSGSVTVMSAMVFATVAIDRPARLMMSPAFASSTGTRSSPWNDRILDARPRLDDLSVVIERVDRLVDLDRARIDAAGQDAAEERIAVQQRDEEK